MKVRELRATLGAVEGLLSECNRLSEINALRQLDALLKDHESSSVSQLVERIRASRSTS